MLAKLQRFNIAGSVVTFLPVLIMIVMIGQFSKPQEADGVAFIPFIAGSAACALLPDNTLTDICGAPADIANNALGAIPGVPAPLDLVKNIVETGADLLLTGIVMFFAAGMVWGLEYTATLISTGITPDITANWFSGPYQMVLWLAVFLAVLLFSVKQVQAAKEKSIGVQVGTLIRTSIFLILAGGFLVNLASAAITLVDREITPGLISQSAEEIRTTFQELREAIGNEIASSIPLAGLLFFVVIGGCLSIALCAVVMTVRYAILPLTVIWLLLALALNIGEEDGTRVKRASLAFLGVVSIPAVIGFVQILSLKALNGTDGVLVTLIAGTAAILPVAVAIWVWRMVSRSDFRIAPVQKVVGAMQASNIYRSFRRK